MSTSEAYGSFAWAYDEALGLRYFESVSSLIEEMLEASGLAGGPHLDVACGSGLAVEWLRGKGFDSVGVDASLPMLAVGRPRSSRLIAGDMRALPFRGNFTLVTSLYDSLNHLLSTRDLRTTFQEVSSLLVEGGIFIFDVNHPAVYPRVWGASEPYESSADDHHLEIRTRWSPLFGRGVARVSGWARNGDGLVTIRERRRQRAWSERKLRRALEEAGLAVQRVIPFDPYAEEEEDHPVKLVFLVRNEKPRLAAGPRAGAGIA